MGGVAVNDGLTVPDVAVRVGGAVGVGVRQQDVIVHGDAARRENGDVSKNTKKKRDAKNVKITSVLCVFIT